MTSVKDLKKQCIELFIQLYVNLFIQLYVNFQVGSVPVLIAMKDGKVLERIVGLQDTDKLRQFVNKYAE